MMIKTVGIILVAVGFALLAIAALLRDPTAPDANIGAGILALAGIPVGTVGIVLTVAGALSQRRVGA